MSALADLVGESPAMEGLRREIRRLLTGRRPGACLPFSSRARRAPARGSSPGLSTAAGPAPGPFVDVNCAAIPDTLLEAELFGFERGAFTDARRSKPGLFQTAHRGTIFLDEVGLLPEGLQAKLLSARGAHRAQARRHRDRAGRRLDPQRDQRRPARGIRERRFREDLYHRLAVLTLTLPPLRDREHDVLMLAERFLARSARSTG